MKAWLKKHPRFHVHFIPTSSSWLNLVERFFAEITGKRIRRGAFASVAELEEAIDDYLLRHNATAKPYRWTKPAADILAKERRALDKLQTIKAGYQTSELGTVETGQYPCYLSFSGRRRRPSPAEPDAPQKSRAHRRRNAGRPGGGAHWLTDRSAPASRP